MLRVFSLLSFRMSLFGTTSGTFYAKRRRPGSSRRKLEIGRKCTLQELEEHVIDWLVWAC